MTAPAPRAAYVTTSFPKLDMDAVRIEDRVADLGLVAMHFGDVAIHLHSEEQARALVEAAGKAAAMFAAAQEASTS